MTIRSHSLFRKPLGSASNAALLPLFLLGISAGEAQADPPEPALVPIASGSYTLELGEVLSVSCGEATEELAHELGMYEGLRNPVDIKVSGEEFDMGLDYGLVLHGWREGNVYFAEGAYERPDIVHDDDDDIEHPDEDLDGPDAGWDEPDGDWDEPDEDLDGPDAGWDEPEEPEEDPEPSSYPYTFEGIAYAPGVLVGEMIFDFPDTDELCEGILATTIVKSPRPEPDEEIHDKPELPEDE